MNELEQLYEWLLDENREPARTKFSKGGLRYVAVEIEFQIDKAKNPEKYSAKKLPPSPPKPRTSEE